MRILGPLFVSTYHMVPYLQNNHAKWPIKYFVRIQQNTGLRLIPSPEILGTNESFHDIKYQPRYVGTSKTDTAFYSSWFKMPTAPETKVSST
jgi:hypothetical protein